MVERAKRFKAQDRTALRYPLSGKIVCGECGSRFGHKVYMHSSPGWICSAFDRKGKKACQSRKVPEYAMDEAVDAVIGGYDNIKVLDFIEVFNNNRLLFHLKNKEIKELYAYFDFPVLPEELKAEDIVKELEKDDRFTNLNIAGPGFINITLTDQYLAKLLTRIYKDKSLNIDKREKKTIILDYGGANVAKALHVGHLRSANIGEALKRLATLLGYKVIGDAHLGDYGRPLGLVVLEIKKR